MEKFMKKLALFVLLAVGVPLVAMQPAAVDTNQALQKIEDQIIDDIIASGIASAGIYDETGALQPLTRDAIRNAFMEHIQAKKNEYLKSIGRLNQ
jgi:hypothetical protein